MVDTSVHTRAPTNPFPVALSNEEFERISSCDSSLHSVLEKTPDLDLIEMTSVALSHVLAQVNERLSVEMHGD